MSQVRKPILFPKAKRPPPESVNHAQLKSRKFGGKGSSRPAHMLSGRWSAEEDERLRTKTIQWLQSKDLTVKDYQEALSSQSRMNLRPETKRMKGLWVYIAQFFPERTVESVKSRGERLFHPGSKKGSWDEKEVERLIDLVQEHGRRWVLIGALLKRDPNSTRDKYRLETEKRKGYGRTPSSRWTKEEEDQLIQLVRNEFPDIDWTSGDRSKIPLYNIPWKVVSAKMHRTKAACMEKWHANLHGRVVGYRVKNWNRQEYSVVIRAVKESGAQQYDQVPWEDLSVIYSAYLCKRHWKNLVRRKKLQDTSFRNQVDVLYQMYCVNDSHSTDEDYPVSVDQSGMVRPGKGAAPSYAKGSRVQEPGGSRSGIPPPPGIPIIGSGGHPVVSSYPGLLRSISHTDLPNPLSHMGSAGTGPRENNLL